jgi:hypothetical protein
MKNVEGLVLARALALGMLVAVLGIGTAQAAAPFAVAARTVYLTETGRLHLTSHHGFRLNEQGSASGTIRGSIYIHLNVTSTNRVSAEVNIYPSGGSLTASGSAGYHPQGAFASFSGTISVNRGTGTYAHAHGSALSFSGTIQRSNDAVNVKLSGKLSF